MISLLQHTTQICNSFKDEYYLIIIIDSKVVTQCLYSFLFIFLFSSLFLILLLCSTLFLATESHSYCVDVQLSFHRFASLPTGLMVLCFEYLTVLQASFFHIHNFCVKINNLIIVLLDCLIYQIRIYCINELSDKQQGKCYKILVELY